MAYPTDGFIEINGDAVIRGWMFATTGDFSGTFSADMVDAIKGLHWQTGTIGGAVAVVPALTFVKYGTILGSPTDYSNPNLQGWAPYYFQWHAGYPQTCPMNPSGGWPATHVRYFGPHNLVFDYSVTYPATTVDHYMALDGAMRWSQTKAGGGHVTLYRNGVVLWDTDTDPNVVTASPLCEGGMAHVWSEVAHAGVTYILRFRLKSISTPSSDTNGDGIFDIQGSPTLSSGQPSDYPPMIFTRFLR